MHQRRTLYRKDLKFIEQCKPSVKHTNVFAENNHLKKLNTFLGGIMGKTRCYCPPLKMLKMLICCGPQADLSNGIFLEKNVDPH